MWAGEGIDLCRDAGQNENKWMQIEKDLEPMETPPHSRLYSDSKLTAWTVTYFSVLIDRSLKKVGNALLEII